MSQAYDIANILSVHHWTDAYFSFKTTRRDGFRFENGQFVMIGLETANSPILRAYSIASANWEDHLEFFSIKVPNGPLTSRLQYIQTGDPILIGKKPTGTLLISDLHPGRILYLLGTGTGLAPWLSIIKDPATYERFQTVVVAHGVRYQQDLAYQEYFQQELTHHEYLGPIIRRQFRYYPAVSREQFPNHGRLTWLLDRGQMQQTLQLPALDPKQDRAMICGSPQMLSDCCALLDQRGFQPSPRIGVPGDYVFERAFVAR